MSDSLEDTELARLLTQLLRVVSPAMTPGAAQAAGRAEPARSARPPGAGAVANGALTAAAGEAIAALTGSGPASEPVGPAQPGKPGSNGTGTPGRHARAARREAAQREALARLAASP